MSSYRLPTTSTRNPAPQRHLSIGVVPGLKVNCDVCGWLIYGDKLVCLCNKCKKYLHPSCAGVEVSVVRVDGRDQVMLPPMETIPQSCRKCSRILQDGIMMINDQISPLSLQQCNSTPAPSSSSVTRFLEFGTKPAHAIIEGNNINRCMMHEHSPGHQLQLKDDWNNYNCSGCKMEGFGSHYSCENASCSFLLHEECISPPITTTRQDLFPGVTFSFHRMRGTVVSFMGKRIFNKKAHSNVFCNVCGMEVNGYYYHTYDGTNNIHPCCMKLARETKCGFTGARMVLQLKSTLKCIYCNRSTMKSESSQHGWSYVAESDNIQLHVGCMMIMMTEMKRDSMGHMISFQMSRENNASNMTLVLAVRDTMAKWEKKFKDFTKYAKIALGAVIAALTGDPTSTTLLVSTIVASFTSQ